MEGNLNDSDEFNVNLETNYSESINQNSIELDSNVNLETNYSESINQNSIELDSNEFNNSILLNNLFDNVMESLIIDEDLDDSFIDVVNSMSNELTEEKNKIEREFTVLSNSIDWNTKEKLEEGYIEEYKDKQDSLRIKLIELESEMINLQEEHYQFIKYYSETDENKAEIKSETIFQSEM
jgi:hypothetical protein